MEGGEVSARAGKVPLGQCELSEIQAATPIPQLKGAVNRQTLGKKENTQIMVQGVFLIDIEGNLVGASWIASPPKSEATLNEFWEVTFFCCIPIIS